MGITVNEAGRRGGLAKIAKLTRQEHRELCSKMAQARVWRPMLQLRARTPGASKPRVIED